LDQEKTEGVLGRRAAADPEKGDEGSPGGQQRGEKKGQGGRKLPPNLNPNLPRF